MESHASTHTSASGVALCGSGYKILATWLGVVLVAAAAAPAESEIADLEPGPLSYQHAQLMADAYAASFGERRPPAPSRVIVRNGEIDDLCRDLDVLQSRLRETEQKLDELNRAMGPGPRREPLREGRDDVKELNHRRERLAERADRQTMELRELREHLADRERQIASELRGIYERMQDIERDLAGLDQQRQERLDRLMAAQNQLREIEARLRDLMAQVAQMQRHVAERMEGNHRQREAIHRAIERTRQEAERVRNQLEEVRRAPVIAPEPAIRLRRTWAPPRPVPAPPTPSPDPALEIELRLLREEVSQLRQQLREAPKRMEVICIQNPHAVGSARGYYWPCR
jgi:DNA repair exonuclease SbcCD ATPase subunit